MKKALLTVSLFAGVLCASAQKLKFSTQPIQATSTMNIQFYDLVVRLPYANFEIKHFREITVKAQGQRVVLDLDKFGYVLYHTRNQSLIDVLASDPVSIVNNDVADSIIFILKNRK